MAERAGNGNSASGISGNPFWDFSLAIYGRPGVAESCLALQDRLGLDVNLLLLCCWTGTRGQGLDAALIARLQGAADPWQREVVRPLRGVRRWLKGRTAAPGDLAAPLRAALKDRELEAEWIEQAILCEALESASCSAALADAGPPLAAANLRAYLRHAGVVTADDDLTALSILLRGAFADLSEETARLLRLGLAQGA